MPGLFIFLYPQFIFVGMSNHKILPATSKNIQDLVQLVNSAYRGEEAKQGWTHEADLIDGTLRTDASSIGEMMDDPEATILIYINDHKIYGCVYLQKRDLHLYLGMLTVSPTFQARGIGKQLIIAAEDFAKKENCFSIEMSVISTRHELIAWYERRGYQSTGRRKPFPDDKKFGTPKEFIEFIILEKKL